MKSLCIGAAALLGIFCSPLGAQEQRETPVPQALEPVPGELDQQVHEVLSAAPVGTRFGLVVERLDGTRLLAISPQERFIPASNTKVYTTLAAYADLARLQAVAQGTGVRIEQAGDGSVDVILEGRGDATLSSATDCAVQCLATLANSVAARTNRVRNVIGDATWYPDERWSPGMSWNNIPFRSGTGVAALSLDSNEILIEITPGEEGSAPIVSSDGYYQIENRAISVAGEQGELSLWRMPGSFLLVVSGTIGTQSQPESFRLAIDDPAHRAAWKLAWLLEERGLQVVGHIEGRYRALRPSDDAQNGDDPGIPSEPAEPMLMQLAPEDLAADIVTINKVSQNLHAELMLRRIGRLSGSGSIASGQAAITALARRAGIDEESFILADGSGMSSYNRLSPDTTAALLRYVAQQPWGEAWRKTLPIGGVDGTLGSRFGETSLKHRIFAKTGSLNASRALSGYMLSASGELLVFSAFANDIPPERENAAVAAIDEALVIIARAF